MSGHSESRDGGALGLSAGSTRADAVRRLTRLFAECGIESGQADARILVAEATASGRVGLVADPDATLGAAFDRLARAARRRLEREPISRILGKKEFWGLEFEIDPNVLDPRPDSETLVEAALAGLGNRRREAMIILDLGLGSGALLAALLKELPNAFGVGVERSPLAALRAQGNLGRLGLLGRAGVVVADWHAPLDGAFDLIVSNPPYIATKEIGLLGPEVRSHDPMLALDGGDDGFAAYRKIIPAAQRLLRADGFVCLECGSGQAAEISKMLEAARLTSIATRRDLAGIERVVMARAAA